MLTQAVEELLSKVKGEFVDHITDVCHRLKDHSFADSSALVSNSVKMSTRYLATIQGIVGPARPKRDENEAGATKVVNVLTLMGRQLIQACMPRYRSNCSLG